MSAFNALKDTALKLSGYLPFGDEKPLTEKEYASIYKQEKQSFVDYLPFYDYDDKEQIFLFDDECSVGTAFELYAFDVDGRSQETFTQLEIDIRRALSTIPEREEDPWILQVFLQDEPIQSLVADIKAYAKPEVRNSELSQEWFDILEEHIGDMCKKDGLFLEDFTGLPWGGQVRRVRCCLYRKYDKRKFFNSKGVLKSEVNSPARELKAVRDMFIRGVNSAGIKSRILNQHDMRSWLFPWFSPNPTGFKDAYEYLKKTPYPGDPESDIEPGAGFDIAETLVVQKPKTDNDGNWYFCDEAQRFIPLQAIDTKPKTGIVTADQKRGDDIATAMWNQMPKNSVFAMTIVIKSQVDVKRHCHNIVQSGKNGSFEAELAAEQADAAREKMARDKSVKLFPLSAGIYIKGKSKSDLEIKTMEAITTLRTSGFNPIEPKNDDLPIDQYIYHLPMAYSEQHDKSNSRRSRLTYTDHLSRILPLYGRGVGSGNPGNILFNRIGEPMLFDQFNKKDRTKTAHGLVFGPTGAGKSATLCFFVLHWASLFGFRFFIIEKGDSFGLITDYMGSKGLSTNKVKFKAKRPPILPPYSETGKALEQLEEHKESPIDKMSLTEIENEEEDEDEEDDEERDYFGEMELLTYLMVTGSDVDEAAKMSRSDKFVLRNSLKSALYKSARNNKPHALPEDVAEELLLASKEEEDSRRASRIKEMSDSLYLWTDGLHGKIFNQYGSAWPEVDVTTIDMGDLTGDNNKDMLVVAMISLINTITGIGEKYQFDDRETVVLTDEGHVLTTQPLLVGPFVFGVKTWRKLGMWLIQATQNLEDYPGIAEKMLNLAEWWYLLCLPKKETDELSKFKTLTNEQKELILQTRKEPGKYTEGVVLSDKLTSMFRVVTPSLPLALAMTDRDEKAERRRTMIENNLNSDLEAATLISKKIREKRLCASI